jgi:hypothetical protein
VAALHRRVVGDDHALAPRHPADAGDDARGRHLAPVHAVCGERRQLEDRRARIDQRVDAVARQELAARDVPRARLLAAAACDLGGLRTKVGHELAHQRRIRAKVLGARIELGLERCHAAKGRCVPGGPEVLDLCNPTCSRSMPANKDEEQVPALPP